MIQAASRAQWNAFSNGEVPPIEQVRPGVFAIALPMPDSTLGYSLSYLIEDGESFHLIDAGVDTDDNWQLLRDSIARVDRTLDGLKTLTITHLHRDHAGLAARLKRASSVSVLMHSADADAVAAHAVHMRTDDLDQCLLEWAVPSNFHEVLRAAAASPVATGPEFTPDVTLSGGERLPIVQGNITTIHTPGHTRGHIVLADLDNRLIFTGDHILPVISTGIGLGGRQLRDRPLADYLRSLEALSPFDDFEVCPGHGYRFTGLAERRAEIVERHATRRREVANVLAETPDASAWHVATSISWTGTWETAKHTHLLPALTQVAMHMEALKSGTQEHARPIR